MSTVTVFDDDLFDAEIVVDRAGGDTFTCIEIGFLMGAPTSNSARQRGVRAKAKGSLPPPAFPGNRNSPDYWSKRQVVEFMARRMLP